MPRGLPSSTLSYVFAIADHTEACISALKKRQTFLYVRNASCSTARDSTKRKYPAYPIPSVNDVYTKLTTRPSHLHMSPVTVLTDVTSLSKTVLSHTSQTVATFGAIPLFTTVTVRHASQSGHLLLETSDCSKLNGTRQLLASQSERAGITGRSSKRLLTPPTPNTSLPTSAEGADILTVETSEEVEATARMSFKLLQTVTAARYP